ncbi:HupE/UreJ family protein [Paracoccus jiaweipingae]|uniref:HupE/UreJ family protein n=1 Tax=unclassified Paracoccus (in: a-proteobacteria) TaxID=2688777 RepID=UPI0037BB5F91
MKRILPALFTLAPTAALAHAGHDTGHFSGGFGHPFSGADHMLAMVALGLLAAQSGGRAIWALPLTFIAAMVAGGAMGAAGVGFPAVEPAILASVMVLGALVALAWRLPLAGLIAMTAVFGAAHGWAHGAEGPAQGPGLGLGLAAYAAGFALATAVLHGAGLALGRLAPAALRLTGGAVAVAGLALVVTA